MQVGELIDLLKHYRGRGDEVTVYNSELDENLIPTKVEWDPRTQTVEITARLARLHYPEMQEPSPPYVEIAKAYADPAYPLELNDVCWINDCGCDGNVHP